MTAHSPPRKSRGYIQRGTGGKTSGSGISVIRTSGLMVSEAGGYDVTAVVLVTQPNSNVAIPISSSDTSEGTIGEANLTFTPSNWNIPQKITVTGVDDLIGDGNTAFSIITAPAVSADPQYNGLDPADISVTNLDDDTPITLFADSFEHGQWNGLWTEDSQNDWFTSTQRKTDGSYSAEVDGYAGNATLTMAQPVDMTPYGSAELTFSWLIEKGFDSGEYLALDFSPDGSTWIEIKRLRGNVDVENAWHDEKKWGGVHFCR